METKESVKHEAVAERARALWEKAGRPGGRDEEFWFQAETELRNEQKAGTPPGIATARSAPPRVPSSPANQVPPTLRSAVKVPARPAAQPRSRKNPRAA